MACVGGDGPTVGLRVGFRVDVGCCSCRFWAFRRVVMRALLILFVSCLVCWMASFGEHRKSVVPRMFFSLVGCEIGLGHSKRPTTVLAVSFRERRPAACLLVVGQVVARAATTNGVS